MDRENIKLAQIANPCIDRIFRGFLAEQYKRLKSKTYKKYEHVIDLLRHHLNGYAYEGLSKSESTLFDNYFNAEGKKHREFCQLFGPEKIIENMESFLTFFMIRKVMTSEELLRSAGVVMRKLSKWLVQNGYITEGTARDREKKCTIMIKDLISAKQAAQILLQSIDNLAFDFSYLNDEDYIEFDHHTIERIESGKLWINVFEDDNEKTIGPIPVPKRATELLQKGWDISCALGRIYGEWRIVEVANVYPI